MPDVFLSSAFNNSYNMHESGMGVTVRNAGGKFFCGFEQPDGSVAFSTYTQYGGNKFEPLGYRPETEKGKPVFLSPEEMKAQGFAAAVYMNGWRGLISTEIPAEGCKIVSVRKDLTMNLKPLEDGPKMGLASVQACLEGTTDGYVLFKDNVKAVKTAVVDFFKKVF